MREPCGFADSAHTRPVGFPRRQARRGSSPDRPFRTAQGTDPDRRVRFQTRAMPPKGKPPSPAAAGRAMTGASPDQVRYSIPSGSAGAVFHHGRDTGRRAGDERCPAALPLPPLDHAAALRLAGGLSAVARPAAVPGGRDLRGPRRRADGQGRRPRAGRLPAAHRALAADRPGAHPRGLRPGRPAGPHGVPELAGLGHPAGDRRPARPGRALPLLADLPPGGLRQGDGAVPGSPLRRLGGARGADRAGGRGHHGGLRAPDAGPAAGPAAGRRGGRRRRSLQHAARRHRVRH